MNVYCLKTPWISVSISEHFSTKESEKSVKIELVNQNKEISRSILYIEEDFLSKILEQIFDLWHPCGEIKGDRYTEYSDRRGNVIIDDNFKFWKIEDLDKMRVKV